MNNDPIVDEVRKVREKLSEKQNFDVGAIFKDLRKKQVAVGSRLVRRIGTKPAEQTVAPDRNSAALHPGR